MLKRQLNPFLLVTTVLVLSLLAGLSVIYQDQLNTVLSDNQELQDEIDDKSDEINSLEEDRSNLEDDLSDTEDDLQNFIDESESLESEVDSLETEIDSLETDLSVLEQEKENISEEKEEIEIDLAGLNSTLRDICENSNNEIEKGDQECSSWGHTYEGEN